MAGVIPLSQVAPAPAGRRVLIACPLSGADEPRIRDAMRGHADVKFASCIRELPGMVAEEQGVIVSVLVAATGREGGDAAPVVRQLVTDYPDVPVVVHCRAGIEHSDALRAVVVAGAHAYLFAGIDDYGVALRAVVDTAARECAGERVLEELLPLVPERLHSFIDACLLRPESATSVARVAELLGVTRKTLFNYCNREQFPPPAELLTWCRLMLASHMLGRTTRTVHAVALELDFPSDTSLRNHFKRYVGLKATDIRSGGGLEAVLVRFRERCTPARAARAANEITPGVTPA